MPRLRPTFGAHAARLALLVGALLCALLAGCDGDEREARAWVRRSAEASARAEQARARGELEAAEQALRGIAEETPPASVAQRDARIVRQEAYHRLALSLLARGQAEEAHRAAAAGLALGEEGDLFGANLLDARGRAAEALGRDREAARDYHRAQEINERLLEELLERAAEE